MSYVSKIPEHTGCINLTANQELLFDTNGLDCTIKPDGTDIFIGTIEISENSNGRFLVREGEDFTFCGKVFIYANDNAQLYFIKYRTL